MQNIEIIVPAWVLLFAAAMLTISCIMQVWRLWLQMTQERRHNEFMLNSLMEGLSVKFASFTSTDEAPAETSTAEKPATTIKEG